MSDSTFYNGSLASLNYTDEDTSCKNLTVQEVLSKIFENDVFGNVLTKCAETMVVKGQDYTVGNQDRLYNFNKVAELTGLTSRQVWSVYACKHLFAILNYVKTNGKSESEPIQGRIVDAINYLLFLSLIEERARHSIAEER